jgi:hypothetical protein
MNRSVACGKYLLKNNGKKGYNFGKISKTKKEWAEKREKSKGAEKGFPKETAYIACSQGG